MGNHSTPMIAFITSFIFVTLPGCGATEGSSPPASDDEAPTKVSQPLNGGPWTWVNAATGRCLDSSDDDVYTLPCNGGSYQRWIDSQNSYGDQIQNLATGYCLDSDGDVYTIPCNGGNFQRWTVRSTPTGWEIKDVATQFCLDSNTGGDVYTLPCNGGKFQRWY